MSEEYSPSQKKQIATAITAAFEGLLVSMSRQSEATPFTWQENALLLHFSYKNAAFVEEFPQNFHLNTNTVGIVTPRLKFDDKNHSPTLKINVERALAKFGTAEAFAQALVPARDTTLEEVAPAVTLGNAINLTGGKALEENWRTLYPTLATRLKEMPAKARVLYGRIINNNPNYSLHKLFEDQTGRGGTDLLDYLNRLSDAEWTTLKASVKEAIDGTAPRDADAILRDVKESMKKQHSPGMLKILREASKPERGTAD